MCKKLLTAFLCGIISALLFVPVSAADKLEYKASADYSAVAQGVNNWYYMVEKDGTYYEMEYDSANDMKEWRKPDMASGNFITGNTMHPGSGNVHTARVWQAPFGGSVRLTSNGNVCKSNTGGGDGITVRIYKNDELLFEKFLEGTDGVGFNYSLDTDVMANDKIYFSIDGGALDHYGATFWDPVITYSKAAVFSSGGKNLTSTKDIVNGQSVSCTLYDGDGVISDDVKVRLALYDNLGRMRMLTPGATVNFGELNGEGASVGIVPNVSESYDGWRIAAFIMTKIDGRYYAVNYSEGFDIR